MESAFHKRFKSAFGYDSDPKTLIEIGCARSRWLPYFATEFGFEVTGLDYSAVGCDQAREILRRENVPGSVVCANLFDPPSELIGKFDVAVSFGVVEHFEDTREAIRAIARLLKPGGLLVTTVPNLVGWIGWIQKRINSKIYDIHVPLDREALCKAHTDAGLAISRCEYFMFTYFGVLNVNESSDRSFVRSAKRLLIRTLEAISLLTWKVETVAGRFPANRSTSPYVLCIARNVTSGAPIHPGSLRTAVQKPAK